jgi:hypothetical protein
MTLRNIFEKVIVHSKSLGTSTTPHGLPGDFGKKNTRH